MDDTFRYLLQSARLISAKRASDEDIEFVKDLILSQIDSLDFFNAQNNPLKKDDFNSYDINWINHKYYYKQNLTNQEVYNLIIDNNIFYTKTKNYAISKTCETLFM